MALNLDECYFTLYGAIQALKQNCIAAQMPTILDLHLNFLMLLSGQGLEQAVPLVADFFNAVVSPFALV